MAVGRELSRITGLPLFHNHLSIEAVLPVFGHGHPAFGRLVTKIRHEVIAEVSRSELPGVIFTYVWAFNAPEDQLYVEAIRDLFEAGGGRVVFVELWADLETRLQRNETTSRLEAKPSKRDVAVSRKHMLAAEEEWRLHSDGRFPLAPHLLIDNSEMTTLDVAKRIAAHFQLQPGGPDI